MKSKLIEAYNQEHLEVYNKQLGVIFNGDNNMKPTIIENLIDSSPTAFQCAWIYETFLGGGGFNADLSKVNLSDDEFDFINPNDLLFDVCESASRHQGAFIHINYNANYEKDSFAVIPYTLCREGKKDSDGFAGKIAVSKKGWGKSLKKNEIDIIDVYNPRPKVIAAQVEAAGGWEFYKGQILHFKLSKKYTYPKSLIETAYTFADVENQLGLFYNGTTKRGFENITFIRHRAFASREDEQAFDANLKKLSGLENASSKMRIQDDWDDEGKQVGNFKFDTLKNEIDAAKYEHFEKSAANYIRKAFKDIPALLVDSIAGKLGNSTGEDMKIAQSIYNAKIAKDQEKVEILFAELFRNYKDNVNPNNDWTIKQYSLLDDGTVDYNGKQPNGLLSLNSTEAVDSILKIKSSLKNKEIEYASAIALVRFCLGFSEEQAIAVLADEKSNTITP